MLTTRGLIWSATALSLLLAPLWGDEICSIEEKVKIDLGPVQQTLLIPLVGRAVETRKGVQMGLIHDPKAVEIVENMEYEDYSRWANSPSISGSVVRTLITDQLVRSFLDKHPGGTIVEIGSGLNTRYERLDNSKANWLEIDLPDSMDLRRRFFAETSNRRMIGASILEVDKWMPFVKNSGGPWCFVSEAVLVYLQESQVRDLLLSILKELNGEVWFVVDTVSAQMVDSQATHPIMRHMSRESWFQWACDDPKATIERDWTQGTLRLLDQKTFADLGSEIATKMPFPQNFLTRFFPFVVRLATKGHFLNVFVREAENQKRNTSLVSLSNHK